MDSNRRGWHFLSRFRRDGGSSDIESGYHPRIEGEVVDSDTTGISMRGCEITSVDAIPGNQLVLRPAVDVLGRINEWIANFDMPSHIGQHGFEGISMCGRDITSEDGAFNGQLFFRPVMEMLSRFNEMRTNFQMPFHIGEQGSDGILTHGHHILTDVDFMFRDQQLWRQIEDFRGGFNRLLANNNSIIEMPSRLGAQVPNGRVAIQNLRNIVYTALNQLSLRSSARRDSIFGNSDNYTGESTNTEAEVKSSDGFIPLMFNFMVGLGTTKYGKAPPEMIRVSAILGLVTASCAMTIHLMSRCGCSQKKLRTVYTIAMGSCFCTLIVAYLTFFQ